MRRLNLGDEGDPAEGLAVPGLHRVRGLRPAQRRGSPPPLRRVRHLLPHLLHGSSARLRPAGQLEVQVVRHLPGVRIQRSRLQLDLEQQLLDVRALLLPSGKSIQGLLPFILPPSLLL